MISVNTGYIESLAPASNEIAEKMLNFLAAGGQIVVGEPCGHELRPAKSEAPAGYGRTRFNNGEPSKVPTLTQREELTLIAKVREMAKTMTQTEICQATDIKRKELARYAFRGRFDFITGSAVSRQKAAARRKELSAAVRGYAEQGMNRTEIGEAMDITRTLVGKIGREFEIEFDPIGLKGRKSIQAMAEAI